jgi:ATP synthase protein I
MVRPASRATERCDRAPIAAGVECMTDDARETDDREQLPADEAALTARFHRLGERLRHVRPDPASEQGQAPRATADPTAIARGFRLSTELVAGVLVGAAIGWALDRWLGISPWGMIVFLLLGFAAGVLNVMRSAGVVPTKTLEPPGPKE